jgi:hypothetical protein
MRLLFKMCGAFVWGLAGVTQAAEPVKTGAARLHDFGLSGSNVGTPGYGRVLVAFALIVALAWGMTWVLRRYGARFRPGVLGAAGVAPPIRLLARDTLPGGVACHLIETQGRQVLITVSRHGVASVLLGEAPMATPAGPAP